MFQRLLRHTLEMNPEYEVHVFGSGKECIDNLKLNPILITLDYSLPDMTGAEIFKNIKAYNPDIPVIILSGQQEVSVAVELLQEGAYDYITKDSETRRKLLNKINQIGQNQSLKKEVDELRSQLSSNYEIRKSIFGESQAMQKVFALIEKASNTNINVSVTGETGTGKELVAKALHFNSPRSKKKFVAVNLTAIPNDLLESELFGHEKGAFTGAQARRLGKFEEAQGGTIFLDEIGEMDINLQAKILRVLQEREITRVGSNEVIKVDARVIVATHRDLAEEVKNGTFREDLFYRVKGLPIQLPPLRERGNDVLILARKFIDAFCKENKMNKLDLSEEAKEKLLTYRFPGNIRELKSVVELACVLAIDNQIREQDLQLNESTSGSNFYDDSLTLKDYERKIIDHYLNLNDQNVLEAAKQLNIGKSTIYRILKEDDKQED